MLTVSVQVSEGLRGIVGRRHQPAVGAAGPAQAARPVVAGSWVRACGTGDDPVRPAAGAPRPAHTVWTI